MTKQFYHSAAIAGAGTGKTYSLVENYLQALFGLDPSREKKRPSEILALTFTDKAANEMRLRIAKRLADLMLHGFINDPIAETADRQGQGLPDREEIRRHLRALPNASIATFHGFAAWLMRTEARVLGLNEHFEIFLPSEELKLARNIMRPLIITRLTAENRLMKSLVARFRLNSGTMSLGLIDGLINFYRDLNEHGIDSEHLSQAALPAISLDSLESAVNNINTIAMTKLARERMSEITLNLTFLREALANQQERDVAKAFSRLRKSVGGNWGDKQARALLVGEVVSLGAGLVDHFVREDEQVVIDIIVHFHRQFTLAKSQLHKLSFADLQIISRRGLAQDPDLRLRLKQRFKHILVDEYQDTSPIQEDIVALLAENRSSAQAISLSNYLDRVSLRSGASLFVVGDKKQSIYGFRGAEVRLFDRIIEKMASTHADSGGFSQKFLTINRRSEPKLLKLINLLAQYSLANQGYLPIHDLEPSSENEDGKAELWVLEDDRDLSRTDANLYCAAIGLSNLIYKQPDRSLHKIVILVRRIKSAIVIKRHLSDLGIAASIVGGEGFFTAQEVVDILAALKLVIDADNKFAQTIVWRSPLVSLTDHELCLLSLANEQVKLSPDSSMKLARFQAALETIRASLYRHGLAWAIDILLGECDFAYYLGQSNQAEQKWANINKLKYLLSQPGQDYAQAIENHYQHIFDDRREALAEPERATDAVMIMTIHQAKGLEFDTVIIADTEGQLPNSSADFLFDHEIGVSIRARGRMIAACEPDHAQTAMAKTRFQNIRLKQAYKEQAEQARLLYVAITRAKRELYLACSQTSFLKPTSAPGLLGLALKAQVHAPQQFNTYCPHRIISQGYNFKKPLAENLAMGEAHIYQPAQQVTRLFSSMLKSHDEDTKMSNNNWVVIDGSLAHQVLAGAGSCLAGAQDINQDLLELLVDAGLRSSGLGPSIYQDATRQACVKTLQLLHPLLRSARQVIFEMPLLVALKPELIIEGIADLVLEFDDFVGVLEFKSSPRLAQHPNTRLQVLAYAAALGRQFSKPIKYGVLLVGADQSPSFKIYTVECELDLLAQNIAIMTIDPVGQSCHDMKA